MLNAAKSGWVEVYWWELGRKLRWGKGWHWAWTFLAVKTQKNNWQSTSPAAYRRKKRSGQVYVYSKMSIPSQIKGTSGDCFARVLHGCLIGSCQFAHRHLSDELIKIFADRLSGIFLRTLQGIQQNDGKDMRTAVMVL